MTITNYKEALDKILKMCYESSDYSRRTQAIHDCAMEALGLTHSQRQERHIRAMMRSEEFKETRLLKGMGAAKKEITTKIEAESHERRQTYPRSIAQAMYG